MTRGWEFDSSQPIYLQIASEISKRISSGVYKPGDRLPSVREFALEAGVNPNTMARALASLEQRGLIVTERATGKFVSTQRSVLMELKQELIADTISQCVQALEQIGLTQEEIVSAVRAYVERSAS